MTVYIPTLERLLNSAQDLAIRDEFLRTQPEDPCLSILSNALACLRGDSVPLPVLENLPPNDRHFVRQIWRLRNLVGPNGQLRSDIVFPSTDTASSDQDFIAKIAGTPWSIARCLNLIALSRIKPTQRAAVVTTMRNEGIHVLEFVAHYRALGFNKIFIFSNDNTDGTSEMLHLLANHNILSYINNPISTSTEPVRKAFEYSVNFLPELRNFEWVFFVDSDEFLVPARKYRFSITSILTALDEAYPNDRPSAVCYFWKWYGGHTFQRVQGLQLQNYNYGVMRSTVKSLVRLCDVQSMEGLHCPTCKGPTFFVNSAFERVGVAEIWNDPAITCEGGWVNHYWHRSFEEYCVKKVRSDVQENIRNETQYFAWNVPNTAEYFNPTPDEIILAVRGEYEELLLLPGVRKENERINSQFPDFLRTLADVAELRRRFNGLTASYPHLRFTDA